MQIGETRREQKIGERFTTEIAADRIGVFARNGHPRFSDKFGVSSPLEATRGNWNEVVHHGQIRLFGSEKITGEWFQHAKDIDYILH